MADPWGWSDPGRVSGRADPGVRCGAGVRVARSGGGGWSSSEGFAAPATPCRSDGAWSPVRRIGGRRLCGNPARSVPHAHIRQHMTRPPAIIMPASPMASREVRACALSVMGDSKADCDGPSQQISGPRPGSGARSAPPGARRHPEEGAISPRGRRAGRPRRRGPGRCSRARSGGRRARPGRWSPRGPRTPSRRRRDPPERRGGRRR
jgi:hypothetical protein